MKTKVVFARVDEKTHMKLIEIAVNMGGDISISHVLRIAIEQYLKRKE